MLPYVRRSTASSFSQFGFADSSDLLLIPFSILLSVSMSSFLFLFFVLQAGFYRFGPGAGRLPGVAARCLPLFGPPRRLALARAAAGIGQQAPLGRAR